MHSLLTSASLQFPFLRYLEADKLKKTLTIYICVHCAELLEQTTIYRKNEQTMSRLIIFNVPFQSVNTVKGFVKNSNDLLYFMMYYVIIYILTEVSNSRGAP